VQAGLQKSSVVNMCSANRTCSVGRVWSNSKGLHFEQSKHQEKRSAIRAVANEDRPYRCSVRWPQLSVLLTIERSSASYSKPNLPEPMSSHTHLRFPASEKSTQSLNTIMSNGYERYVIVWHAPNSSALTSEFPAGRSAPSRSAEGEPNWFL